MFVHGRNVHELFISSTSRVVRMYNLGPEAAKTVAAMLQANNVMLPSWSLHEQFGGAPFGHESSIWCVFRTHDDACRALRLDGLDGISVSSALEDDLKPFSKLRRFDMYDDDASLNINFSSVSAFPNQPCVSDHLAPMARRTASPNTQANVIYSSNPTDDMYLPSPSKNSGFLTPPTPTTALSSCGSSSEDGASPPSSTLSLYGQPGFVASGLVSSFDPVQANSAQLDYGSSFGAGFTMSTNPPSPRNAFKQGDWICHTQTCATHNFGRNTSCISCNAPRPLRLSTPATDYDRYFDARSTLPLSPPPPRRLAPLPPPAPLPGRPSQPPRLPSILTPSGRGFARGGRIQNVSPIPSMPLVMFWPDNEPLPQPCQIRPPFAHGAHPPIMNTGNRGPVEHQPGDWYCGKCSYMNWRRRKVCQTCFPFADGNADSVPPSAQAERINMLAQMAQLELSPKSELMSPTSPASSHGLGLQFVDTPKANLDSLASTFGSLSLDRRAPSIDRQLPLSIDRRASVGHTALAMNRSQHHALRTRQSDAGLHLSGTPFSTRPRASDAGPYSTRTRASDAGLYGDMGLNESTTHNNSLPRRLPSDLPDAGLTYGLGRRTSAANIWATDSVPTKSLWPRA